MYLLSKKPTKDGRKTENRDTIKYYLHKSVKYLKKGFQFCRTKRDKARINLMLSDSYIILAEKQIDMVKRAKCYKICCYHLNKAIGETTDFDEIILYEKQMLLNESIHKYIKSHRAELDFVCEVYLSLFNSIHDKMENLKNNIGNQLFNSYFKYGQELQGRYGNKKMALKVFNKCM